MTRYLAGGGASGVAATAPVAYINKRREAKSRESATAQKPFFDLSRMLVEPTEPTTGSRPENGNPVPLTAKDRPNFEKICIRFDD